MISICCSMFSNVFLSLNLFVDIQFPTIRFTLDEYKKSCFSKGMLDSEDLNGAIIFLLSKSSKYINGQNIIIDDGWST